jgi:probable rRNA maturation factor
VNKIEVTEENIPPPAWKRRVRRFIRTVLRRMHKYKWRVSVLFCDDAFIRELNQRYRNIDGPTDVLSFRQADDATSSRNEDTIGDIVISLDMMEQNARRFGFSRDEELKRLVVHGLLHLAGMDHDDTDENDPMLGLQHQLLHELPGRRVL